jgi:5'(3')-deoxyribonucleotidase
MKVFLDMDGVLVDFMGGLHKSLRLPYSYEAYPYQKGKWIMLTGIRGFADIPATFEQCDECCSSIFWKNLEWMHDGHHILNTVAAKFGVKNIQLLTTPMPNIGSWTGKYRWVHRHLPDFVKRLIVTRAPKSLLAGPDTLLIDDKDENVEEFRAVGGQAILVPRPWNKLHDCQRSARDYVAHKLEEVVV